LDLVAVWENGIIFKGSDLAIDEEEYLRNITSAAQWAINLSVEAAGSISRSLDLNEEQDIDFETTALREFFEETGANETPFIIGKLSDVYIPISKFIVKPYVGYLPERPQFLINEDEVVKLIEWDLQDLLQQNGIKKTNITVNNINITTPYYLVEGKILWGATAMIMNELKHLIKERF
jgi:hypothetical protein